MIWMASLVTENVKLFETTLPLHMVPWALNGLASWPTHHISAHLLKSQLKSNPSLKPSSTLKVMSNVLSCMFPKYCRHTFTFPPTRPCWSHQILHSPFLLFPVAMFYEVIRNTELANSEPLLLREIEGQVPVSLYSHIFINWSVHNLGQYVFLFKDTLLTLHCCFTDIEFTANATLAPITLEQSLSNTDMFSSKAHHSLLTLRNTT